MPDDPTTPASGPPDPPADGPNLDSATLQAKLTGTQGRLKQVQEMLKAREETWGLERQTLSEQLAAAQKATTELGAKVEEYKPILEAKSTLEQQLAAAQAQAAKQEMLIKYPRLLRDDLRALVTSSSLDGEALEGYLKSLDEAFAKTGQAPPGGSTPPPPPTPGEPKSEEVLDQALKAMTSGDTRRFDELMSKYYQLLDKEKGKFVPAEVATAGDLPIKEK